MKDVHEDEGMTNPPQQKDHRKGVKDNQRRTSTTSRTGEEGRRKGRGRKQHQAAQQAQQGAPYWGQSLECVSRLMNNSAPHTNAREGGDATRKRREQTHPRPWQQPGSALKGKEKAESEHPGRPTTEAATVGRGTNNPLKA